MDYVKVAVFTKTLENQDIFTYELGSLNADVGQVLLVPFKNRELYGVVIEKTAEKPHFDTKRALKVLDIIIPEHLIKTALFISEYYLCPFSLTLKTMLPSGFYKKRRTVENLEISAKAELPNFTPNKDQKEAIDRVLNSKSNKPTLLFGVTGSGKTEVYLKIIKKITDQKRSAIVLVPEISLTPQTIKRFEKIFPNKISVLHSRLKETERQKEWNSLLNGEKQIVIGPRSAIFAPLKNLGVIVIDEEHEASYKQESSPRYDTRTVAEYISKTTGAKLILGSATPRIEDFFKAKNKEYNLLELKSRVSNQKMPKVKLVNLKEEYKKNNYSPISYELETELKKTLGKKRKAILFLNRRGNATYVFCRDCGHTEKCPQCDIPLIHHFTDKENILKCHHCGQKKAIPLKCENCQSLAIKYYGLGIQRVELELKKLFPKVKIIRLDKDTAKVPGFYKEAFQNFSSKEGQILLGTQMVAKGWDIPEVDLVGVISADHALNFPDFRAEERTFQLLSQVSGRSGRKDSEGLSIIQTFNEENPIFEFLINHDYVSFFDSQIKAREKFGYPPFSRIIRLIYKDESQKITQEKGEKLKDRLEEKLKTTYNTRVDLLGPSPCFVSKVGGKYRWQIILKIHESNDLEILKEIPKEWTIDIDPVNLL